MSRERLLQRFLKYTQIDTTAGHPGGDYPSSQGQRVLGKVLTDELIKMGVVDADQDQFGLVYGTVQGKVMGCPVVALNSHVDTSPETTGANVKPQVIEDYAGGDIPLPGDPSKVITVRGRSSRPIRRCSRIGSRAATGPPSPSTARSTATRSR